MVGRVKLPRQQSSPMRIFRHWKVILAAVLVFGAGGVTGSVLSLLHFKHAFERGLTVENWTSTGMKFLQNELELTPEQAPRIRTILEETGQQFAQTFREAINVSGTNLVASWIRID